MSADVVWEIAGEHELDTVAASVFTELLETGKHTDGAMVLALHGDLGAGKTTFVQKLVAQLGNCESVTSPTFVIMKRYELTAPDVEALVHIDAYRIEDSDEMRPLHFEEVLSQPKTIVCIEWAEKIAELLPEHTVHLVIEHPTQEENEHARRCTLQKHHGEKN